MSGPTRDPAPAAKANRFASLLSGAANAKASPAAPPESEEAPAPVATAAAPPAAEAAAAALPSPTAAAPTAAAPRGPGRPRGGKRSDPSYTQVTAYVRAATYRDVKLALLRSDEPREFSDLVEELLAEWLRRER